MKLNRLFPKVAISFLIFFSSLLAQDRVFTYTYQSGVLAKGETELEVWNSIRINRENYFRKLINRLEFETGLGAGVQTAFYLNFASRSQFKNGSILTGIPEISFSNEWKFKISDPAAEPVGFAIYGEYLISTSEMEVETKLILDKVFNNFVHAFNIVGEAGWEKNEEPIYELNVFYGISFRVSKNFSLGLELFWTNKFESRAEEESASISASSLFAGPVISFVSEGYWVNFTLIPQIKGFYSRAGNNSNGLILNDFEKVRARLIFSIALGGNHAD